MRAPSGSAPTRAVAARADPVHLRGVALVATAGVFWSLGGVLVRWIEAADPWQIIFYRSLALALTLLAVLGLRHRRRVTAAFAAAGWNGVVAGACLSGGFIGFIVALAHTTVANAVFMLGAAPFFAALLGRWWLGEAVRRATWLAMAVAAVGILTMVANGIALGTVRGNLLALATAFCFATFSVLLRRGRDQDTMPCVVHAGLIAALIAGVVLIAGQEAPAALAVSGRDLALCLTMGSVQVGAGMILFTLGARHVPAAELTLLSLTELVFAPVWVWLAVGEVPSPLTVVGGAILMAAIVYQALSGARRPRPHAIV